MHVKVPETVWYASHNYSGNMFGWETDGHNAYVVPWLADPKDLVPDKDHSQTIYFREKRRRDYSDVCHAKLLWPDDPLTDSPIGVYKIDDYNYFGGRMSFVRQPSTDGWSLGGACAVISNGRLCFRASIYCTRETGSRYRFEANMVAYRWKTPGASTWGGNVYYAQSSRNMKYDTVSGKWTVSKETPDHMQQQDYLDAILRGCSHEDIVNRRIGDWAQRSCERLVNMAYYWRIENPEFTNAKTSFSRAKPTLCESPKDVFLLHEPEAIMDGTDDMLMGKGTEKYFRNVLIQHAFLEMVTNVPRMNDNNISNMLEIIGFMKSLVIDHRIEVPESLADLWLAYRYSYGTTKLDAEEAIKFVHRHMDLGDWTKIKCYGMHTLEYKGAHVTCRCESQVIPRVMSTVGRLWRNLHTYGLSPGFYVVWDMIPYSFIVDWFLPIGDVMAAWDAKRVVDEYYDFKGINMSLSYTRVIDGYTVKCYTRWLSATPIPLQGYYFLEGSGPSNKTVIKRVLDAASLLMG
jgi:hypothetical protein